VRHLGVLTGMAMRDCLHMVHADRIDQKALRWPIRHRT